MRFLILVQRILSICDTPLILLVTPIYHIALFINVISMSIGNVEIRWPLASRQAIVGI